MKALVFIALALLVSSCETIQDINSAIHWSPDTALEEMEGGCETINYEYNPTSYRIAGTINGVAQFTLDVTENNRKQTVYVTTYGGRYHESGCRYLHSSKRAITLGDAIYEGYTRDKSGVCNPPTLQPVRYKILVTNGQEYVIEVSGTFMLDSNNDLDAAYNFNREDGEVKYTGWKLNGQQCHRPDREGYNRNHKYVYTITPEINAKAIFIEIAESYRNLDNNSGELNFRVYQR